MADRLAVLPGQLTDRDRAIIRLVFEHRVFTTHQLIQVLFGSQDRAEHRQALARQGRWNRVPFLVATASPMLGTRPAEAAWLPLRQTWPRRRLIELTDLDGEES